MKQLSLNIRLLIVFVVFMAGFIVSNFGFAGIEKKEYDLQMQQAVELTKEWFKIVQYQKEKRGINSDVTSNVLHNYMIGNDFTPITTTLGSLNAKEISTNPDFAALIVKFIKKAEIENGETIGVILSGSFPSLAISTLAALQTLKLDVVLMSSLGASSYGANQPDATWLDIETWLIENGGLKYKSLLVSMGAENDNGSGISDEGIRLMKEAAYRNNRELFIPESLNQSINKRVNIFTSKDISLLINIGGNHASLGKCTHSVSIPNGFNNTIQLCDDNNRGVIQEINSHGVPIINLLNIKGLASKYGIDIYPGIRYSESLNLFNKTKQNQVAHTVVLIICLLSLLILTNRNISIYKKN